MENTLKDITPVNDMEKLDKKEVEEIVDEGNLKRTEKSDTAPISNTVIAAVTFLLWPVAWGLLTYVSLKNLWKETAIYAFITSLVLTAIVSYILMVPLADVEVSWIYIQAPMALVLILFQHKAVKQWALQNPTIKYRTSPKDIGWVLLWFILYFVVAFIVALFVTPA